MSAFSRGEIDVAALKRKSRCKNQVMKNNLGPSDIA